MERRADEKVVWELPANKLELNRILDQITCVATGGMAQIFKARQPSLDRHVVIKKLRKDLRDNGTLLERFRREAKALAMVLHQNVAHVYDFIELDGESLILMEYIEGIDLSHVIQKLGNLPPEIAAAILLGVARGVSCIHSHNLIHRDIKPANIRLNTRGEVKLMDFGIVMGTDTQGLTLPGVMVGSPYYLSPEQVLGEAVTPKSDLFLLGICLYEMLTGTRPFREEENGTVFSRIREVKYQPIRSRLPSVPRALERVIRKTLTKNPDERYKDVKTLIAELESFLEPHKATHTDELVLQFLDREALLTPSTDYRSIDQSHTTSSARIAMRPWLAGVLGFLLGCVLSFGLGLLLDSRSHPVLEGYPPPVTIKK